MNDFGTWFSKVTGTESGAGFAPHPWQLDLAEGENRRNRLIRIPTGMGKTLGVLTAWVFHRIARQKKSWPARLVWCLPMRTLVEQTETEARRILDQLEIGDQVDVHVLMGGIEEDRWYGKPQRPAIFIGTQDMLLSRALNRGYGMGSAAWPRPFGLLNTDALWVMDEVQLMGVGLATSSQLQAFYEEDRNAGKPVVGSRVTWWMSATLQPDWLRTPETEPFLSALREGMLRVASTDRRGPQWEAIKTLQISETEPTTWAEQIAKAHNEHAADSATGRQTLVVVNTVKTAIQLFEEITNHHRNAETEIKLIHSRFRRNDRKAWSDLLSRNKLTPGVNRILVATQVVEAGVDISSSCLITELAPWPSLVQRFGRAARYGGTASVIVLDAKLEGKSALPYQEPELAAARDALSRLTDVSIRELEKFEEQLAQADAERLKQLYSYEPRHVLLRHEFEELFDTSPDLSGADIDVSRFIREEAIRDLQVFWQEWEGDRPPASLQPHAEELCPAPFDDVVDWIKKESERVWAWDYLDGMWKKAVKEQLRPGMIVLAAPEAGGYEAEGRGFVGTKSKRTVEPVPSVSVKQAPAEADLAVRSEVSEQLSESQWKTIATHCQEAQRIGRDLADSAGLNERCAYLVQLALRLHDWGKAHPAFATGTYRVVPERVDLAKAPRAAWRPNGQLYDTPTHGHRKGFRHELASGLATLELLRRAYPEHAALTGEFRELLQACGRIEPQEAADCFDNSIASELNELSSQEFDLLLFLIVCHHGKVRASFQSSPADQDFPCEDQQIVGSGMPIRGVREGDELPTIVLPDANGRPVEMPALTLSLAPAGMGLSTRYGRSWSDRMAGLLANYGPFVLGHLEAIIRAADGRASDDQQSPGSDLDPLLDGATLAYPSKSAELETTRS